MSQIHLCADQSDTTSLCAVLGLFLKPIARINITVHFPTLKQALPVGGKSVSSWEVMEKIKGLVSPENFISLKVVKNTLEFIRFEGDLENRNILKTIINRIDGKALKLTGFKELLKIRAAETKIPFPSKYDWDSFFRDAKHMNEMKAGERPDTIHFQNLPSKWFSDKKNVDKPIPSEKLFRRVWETFGEVRCIDIPVLDPYRQQMQSGIAGIKTFTFSQDPVFEAYVQFKDYLSFVKAMDSLRNCFLLYQEDNKAWVASIKVNFDKSKHLSDESIRKRRVERERLIEEEKLRERAKLKLKGSTNDSAATSTKSNDLTKEETERVEYKIAKEERMYMVARRKLESVRLLDYIFDRVKKQRHLDMKEVCDDDDRTSQPSSASRSDRLSPSFYNVERSPRIEKCRPSRSVSPLELSSHRSRSPPHYSRTRSPYNSRRQDGTPTRDTSPSWIDRDHRNSRYDRSYERVPQEENSSIRYMNDWEVKPYRGSHYERGPGRFRGRGNVYRSPRGRPYHQRSYHNYSESNDYDNRFTVNHSLQEAYNHAYTKYFNSISKTSGSRSSERESDRIRNDSRSHSRSPD